MSITPIYAAILALLFVALSVRVILVRRRLRVAIGHGDQPSLERATRVHANFAEYVPIALLLIHFLETIVASRVWIHILALILIAGRIAHAVGVRRVREDLRLRVTGMALTFTALLGAAIGILVSSIA